MKEVRWFPGLLSHLETPPAEWFDSGLDWSSHTIGLAEIGLDYARAWVDLETIVGHRFTWMVANAYNRTTSMRPHHDKPEIWGAFAIISLGEATAFWLTPAEGESQAMWLQHGDVLYLNEAANAHYEHSGLMTPGRYSLVLRERNGAHSNGAAEAARSCEDGERSSD